MAKCIQTKGRILTALFALAAHSVGAPLQISTDESQNSGNALIVHEDGITTVGNLSVTGSAALELVTSGSSVIEFNPGTVLAPGPDGSTIAYVESDQDLFAGLLAIAKDIVLTPAERLPSTPKAGSRFGSGLALDPALNRMLVRSATGLSIYERSGANWNEQPVQTGSADLNFGNSNYSGNTAIEGNWAFVGNPLANSAKGAVFVFQRTSAGWKLFETIALPASWGAQTEFGASLAVSTQRIVVGAPEAIDVNHPERGVGRAFVYRYINGSWTSESPTELRLSNPGGGNRFGFAVDISGVNLASSEGDPLGSAAETTLLQPFRDGAAGWTANESLFADEPGNRFGWSLSLSGERLAVGAPRSNVNGIQRSGSVYLFQRDSSSSGWNAIASPIKPWNPEANLGFGATIDLYGDTLVVGSSLAKDIYVYRISPDGNAVNLLGTLVVNDVAQSSANNSLAIGQDYILIGNESETVAGAAQAGSVYVHSLDSPATPPVITAPLFGDLTANPFQISIDEDRIQWSGSLVGNYSGADLGYGIKPSLTSNATGNFGTMVLTNNGDLDYQITRDLGYLSVNSTPLEDRFEYTVTDGYNMAKSEIVVQISGRNDAPIISSSSQEIRLSSSATTGSIDSLLAAIGATDPDSDPLAVRFQSGKNGQGSWGTLAISNPTLGTLKYTLDRAKFTASGQNGVTDPFSLEIYDGNGGTRSVSVICRIGSFTSNSIKIEQIAAQGISSPNRPAHFNWEFVSSGGGKPIYGQFACGSYWVAPAPGDSGVRLLALTGSGKPGQNDLLFMDDDPWSHSNGLTNGQLKYGSNDPNANELKKLPRLYTPESASYISLVASMQRNEAETSPAGTNAIKGEAIDAYCFMTVLSAPPAEGGANTLRPSFVGGGKKEIFTWDDFDLTRLPSSDLIPSNDNIVGAASSWRHATEVFSMYTWDGDSWETYSEGGRAFRPHLLVGNYASLNASRVNNAMLSLFTSKDSLDQKKPLLAALISYGLDTWNHVYGRDGFPGAWGSGAGQWNGQFMPAVFATALLKDPTKSLPLSRVAAHAWDSDASLAGPQELRQICRGETGVLLWGDGHEPNFPPTAVGRTIPDPYRRYWNDFRWAGCYAGSNVNCNASVGQRNTADPYGYIDGPPAVPGSSYLQVTQGSFRGMAAIMILFPDARRIVNTDSVIEYADRLDRVGRWTSPDPLAAVDPIDQVNCNVWYPSNGSDGCQGYTVTWGPNPDDIRYGIENGIGRFDESTHGDPIDIGYPSSLAENKWAEIMAQYDGLRYEDYFVPLGTCVRPDITVVFEGGHQLVYLFTGTTDGNIHYTTDGSTPTKSSPLYSGPFPSNPGKTIKAKTFKSGLKESVVTSKVVQAIR